MSAINGGATGVSVLRAAGALMGGAAISALAVFAFGVIFCGQLGAQVTSGSIVGVVYDSSGAAIGKTTVTATDLATGAVREVETNDIGYYAIPSLPPDSYRLTASAQGFEATDAQILVALGQTANFDFHLTPGSISETIQVNADSSRLQLETTSHEAGSLVASEDVENLPANGRDVFQTLQAATNVAPFQNAPGPISNFRTTTNSVTIGGSASGMTTYLQDGVTNIAVLTKTANFQPSIEAVEEVSIVQNGASPRFDEPSVVNVITKSGSNRFHGRLYDYLKNDALETVGYFKVAKPPLRYNQFGANLGGPIVKNKLFFFFDYSGLRETQGTTLFANVPTQPERGGDFQQDSFTIYDPSTYNPQTGTISAFQNNTIPSGEISNFAKQFLAYYPLPSPGGSVIAGDNFQQNVNDTTTYDSYLGRVDYNIGSADTLYGAYESTNPSTLDPTFSASTIFNYINVQSAKNAYVQETHTFNANAINVGRFGYNNSNIYYSTTGTGSADFVTQFGLQNLNPAPSQYAPPAVSLTTHSGLGSPTSPQGALQNLYEFADEVNLIHGKHNIFFGGELDKMDMHGNWTIWNSGQFTFNGQFTSNHNASHLSGGSDLADFLLGYPSSAEGGTGVTVADFREWNLLPYVEDDWRATNRLTFNVGLRYDYYSSPDDTHGHSNVYDLATNTNHPGTFEQAYRNFAPRAGFAYSIDDNTAIHGGYGIYYSPFQYNQLQFLMINEPNFFLQLDTYALANPTPVTTTFVANPTLSAEAPFTIQLNMKTPYVEQWNLAIQRTLGTQWIATIAYIGNKSDHLEIRQNPNQASLPANPANPTSIQSRRPYPYVGDVYQISSIAYGNYNGLEGELERHFANGLSFLANYVWSKSMDALNNGAENPQYGPDVQAEYGQSDFNPGQTFKLSGIYQLPVGQGRRFLGSANRLTDRALGGWQASGILTVQSGLPFNVSATDLSDTGGDHAQRANQVCNGNDPANQSITHWFNTACYVQTGLGQFGNEQRDNIIGPRTTNLDLSFFKAFALREGSSLQFRSDFFDALNHPLLGIPSATVSASTYGQITSITGQRTVQFSLKLLF
jgi:Carboxypeptidase regulatory-like domain/TonB dependent receptor